MTECDFAGIVQPLILGRTGETARLAFSLYVRLGTKPALFLDAVPFAWRFVGAWTLHRFAVRRDEMRLMALFAYASEHENMTLCLVPQGRAAERFVERNRSCLSSVFLITENPLPFFLGEKEETV